MVSRYIQPKLTIDQKYIVSFAFGTYFNLGLSNSGLVSRGAIWVPAVNYQLFWGRSFSFKTSLITAKIGNNIKETLKNAMIYFFLKSGGCMFPWQQLKLKNSFHSSWFAFIKLRFCLMASKTTSLHSTPKTT